MFRRVGTVLAALAVLVAVLVVTRNSGHRSSSYSSTTQAPGPVPSGLSSAAPVTAPVVQSSSPSTPGSSPSVPVVKDEQAASVAEEWFIARFRNDSQESADYLGYEARTAPFQTPAFTAKVKVAGAAVTSFGGWSLFVANRCRNEIPDASVYYPDDMNRPASAYHNTATSQYAYVTGTVNTLCQLANIQGPYRITSFLHLSLVGGVWLVDNVLKY